MTTLNVYAPSNASTFAATRAATAGASHAETHPAGGSRASSQPGLHTSPSPSSPPAAVLPAPDRVDVGAPATAAPGLRRSALGLPGTAPGRDRAMAVPQSATEGEAPATQPPAEQGSWTIAVNLSANLKDSQTGENKFGAEEKTDQLLSLAEQTQGTDVTIVAQETIEGPDGGPQVKTYTIADGEVTEGETLPSEGAAKDLENLVANAYTQHPAEKTALIQQSHGSGPLGVNSDADKAGDTDEASLDETSKAIRSGLDRAGVDKLDTLNFDGCLMADTAVIGEMAAVADHVVASEELELGNDATLGGAVDGQNLNDSLSALIANPAMDGQQLGDAMVEAAERNQKPLDQSGQGPAGTTPDPASPGAYRSPEYATGTPTLANFDTAGHEAYRASLDDLGTALNEAMADPASEAAIQQAIEETPRMGAGAPGSEARGGQRDVKAFTEQLESAIADGSLPDPDGQIAAAARQTREDLGKLVESYHGDPNGAGYEDLGGLSAFLPDQTLLDTAGNAEGNGSVAQLAKMNESVQAKFDQTPPEGRVAAVTPLAANVNRFVTMAREALPPALHGDLAGLEAVAGSLATAKTPEEAAAALAELDAATKAFTASPAAREATREQQATYEENLDALYEGSRHGDGTGGWNHFTEALRA